jgi:DNA repair photolyase
VLGKPLSNPPNPWASSETQYLPELGDAPRAQVVVYEDSTRQIIAENKSPDVPFDYSVNPYRGCMHACAYCYARPGHEYLSFGAGTDFDTKIVIKPNAPALLRAAFERPSWKGEELAFSGVTDCYQPLEASLRLTRGCLEVCAEYQNPIGIVTKAPLVERDIDVLQTLVRVARAHVMVSIPFWDEARARAIEPVVATPLRRIKTIERLARAGIPVGVMTAPIIPGLNDEDMPRVLEAAAAAGATSAGYVLLRLPGSVAPVFEERVRAAMPLRADKILRRVRETRGGALYESEFGKRQTGEGRYAEMIEQLFASTCRRLGLHAGDGERGTGRLGRDAAKPSTFRRPDKPGQQLGLWSL